MKEIYLIMEKWNEEEVNGYVNSVYENLENAKVMAKLLKEAWNGSNYYYNWIITRPLN